MLKLFIIIKVLEVWEMRTLKQIFEVLIFYVFWFVFCFFGGLGIFIRWFFKETNTIYLTHKARFCELERNQDSDNCLWLRMGCIYYYYEKNQQFMGARGAKRHLH